MAGQGASSPQCTSRLTFPCPQVSSVSEGALRLAALAGAAPAVTVSTSAGQGTTTETLSAPAPRQASSLQRGMQSLTMNPTTSTASAGAVQSAPRQHARSSSQVFSGQVASCFPHHSTVPTAETSTQQQDAGAIRPQQGQGEGRGQGVCVPVGPEVAQGQGGVSGSVRASKRLCSQPTLSSAMPERGSGASAGAAAAHGHGIVIGGAQAVPVCEHSHSVGSLPVFLAADTRSDVVIGGMHNAVSFQRMPQHPQHGQGAVELASNHHGSYQLPCEWPGMPSNSQGRGQHRVPVTPGTSCTAHANGAGVEGDDYLSYMLECMSDMDGQIGGEPGETGMSAQAPQFTGCAAPVPMLFPFGAAGVCNPAPATNGWPLAHGCGSLSTAVPPQRAVLPIPTTPSTVGHATPSQAGSCGAMCQQPQIRNLADYIGAPLDSRPVSFSASRPDSTGQNSRPPSGATARSSTCFGPPCAAAPEMMPTATFGSLGGDVTSAGGEIGRFRGLQPTGSALSMGQQVRPYGPDHTSAPNGICGVGATGPVRSDYNVAGHAFASGGSALANRLQLPASTGLRSSLLSHTEHLVQAAEARRSAAGADREEPDPVKRMMRMPSNFVTNTAVQQGQASSVLMHQSMRVQVPAPPGFVDMSSGGGGLPLGGAGQDGGWAAPAAGSTCYPPQSATVTNLRLMLADRLAQIQAEGAAARSRNSVPTSGSAVSSLNVSAHSCSRSASNRQGSGSSTVQMMSSANVSGNYSSSHTVTTHHRLSGAESSGAGSLRQVVTLESLAECDISAGMFW